MTHSKISKRETEEFLHLLRAIEANPCFTQRELSASLGLSLGKINYLIKAMIKTGLIKAENFKNSRNKISYLYCLTPAGLQAKTTITCRFLKRKVAEYEKLEQEIRQLEKEIETETYTLSNG